MALRVTARLAQRLGTMAPIQASPGQANSGRGLVRTQALRLGGASSGAAVQREMRGAGDGGACHDGLELCAGLEPLHGLAQARRVRPAARSEPALRRPGACGPWRGER